MESASLPPSLSLLPYVTTTETSFDTKQARQWMRQNWTVAIKVSLVYVVLVFLGKMFMKNRKPFDLRLPLILWSTALSLFSLWGSLRLVPDLFTFVSKHGFLKSICPNDLDQDSIVDHCIHLFIWSKIPELVDTGFIILRNKKLIFLHWYHHATVLIFSFHAFGYGDGMPIRWFSGMNFFVHFLMYGYYALSAAGVRSPKLVALAITTIQILQMVVGLVTCTSGLLMLHLSPSTNSCDPETYYAFLHGFLIYVSYFFLFANFFIKSYLTPAKRKAA
ncbi:putative fatty acid elongation protein 3 [Halotydeus destructor]|nr:putative fatty acid elongation protein 3 [Halotydeus destructor]